MILHKQIIRHNGESFSSFCCVNCIIVIITIISSRTQHNFHIVHLAYADTDADTNGPDQQHQP